MVATSVIPWGQPERKKTDKSKDLYVYKANKRKVEKVPVRDDATHNEFENELFEFFQNRSSETLNKEEIFRKSSLGIYKDKDVRDLWANYCKSKS
jgi:hypothetical protein